jgi:hypothetical protein
MEVLFQALCYENDGEICIITGPVTMPRYEDDEQILILPDVSWIGNKSPKW